MNADDKLDLMAKVMIEAAIEGDEAPCKRNGVSTRTLQRWRRRLKAGLEPDLAAAVAAKKSKVEEGWAEKIPGALKQAVEFLTRAARDADCKDPAVIHSIAGAMKLLSEVAVTWKVLDARLARQAGQARAADGSLPAGAGAGGTPSSDGRPAQATGTATH